MNESIHVFLFHSLEYIKYHKVLEDLYISLVNFYTDNLKSLSYHFPYMNYSLRS